MQWTQARRAQKMNPSVIREILKVTQNPEIISFAGGLPSPDHFPAAAFARADANGDGKLSADEAATLPAIGNRFEQLDADRDSSLSRTEFEKGAKY